MSQCPPSPVIIATGDPQMNALLGQLNNQIQMMWKFFSSPTNIKNILNQSNGGLINGDNVWLQASGTTISHIGPSTPTATINSISLLTIGNSGANMSLSVGGTSTGFDAKGHGAAAASQTPLAVTFAPDSWIGLSVSGSNCNLTHSTPQTHNGTFDFNALSSAASSGTVITLKTRTFFVDGRGHKDSTNANETTSVAFNVVPSFPPNDGNYYGLVILNGTMSWVLIGAC